MATVWYATREQVKAALDTAETARNDAQVDRAIGSATDTIFQLTHRRFWPQTATRFFPWPNRQYARAWRLWLDGDELVSVTILVAGGTTIPPTDYFLEPVNTGPPFTSIEIDLSSSSAFSSGATWQRAIAITGEFGHSADDESVGSLGGTLAAADDSTAAITWTTARVGVGDILHIDDERMIVAERTMVDSTQNTGGALTSSSADDTVSVTDGTAFDTDEILLVDSERMLIVDIADNTLTVKRAWDGTILATHNSGADIYTLTGVELSRGQLGTTATSHTSSTTIYRHVVPNLIRDLAIAEAINQLQLETSGYARVIGEGDNAREGTGRSLFDLRRDVERRYGRQARVGAV
jgi:hypothetical protein